VNGYVNVNKFYLAKPYLEFAVRSQLIVKTKVLGDAVALVVAKSLE
jgi:hypothetical protein